MVEQNRRGSVKKCRFFERTAILLLQDNPRVAITREISNLPTHYTYILGDAFAEELETFRQILKTGIRSRSETRIDAEKVTAALQSQTDAGYWLSEGGLIDAGLFGLNFELMCEYISSFNSSPELVE